MGARSGLTRDVIPYNSSDDELFTAANPGDVSRAIVAEAAWTTLIDAVLFDDDPTSQNSAVMDVDGYRGVWVLLNIDSTGTSAQIIQFVPQFSDDGGTTYWDYGEGFWASMIFEDVDTASGVKKAFLLPVEGIDDWRMRVVCTGTDATYKFTVTVKARAFK